MDCIVCQQVEKRLGVVFEDSDTVALLSPTPASAGHIIIAPKQHHVILEQVPDWIVGKLFTVANKVSISLFEGLGVHGTNLLIQNGAAAGQTAPHVSVHVIPRVENDDINLIWQPRQIDEEEMSTIELNLKEETNNLVLEKEPPKPKVEEQKTKKVEYAFSEEENYLIKSLRRIP